jgi:peroxiredoxin Q/BCP
VALGAAVLGVSPDGVESHRRFHEQLRLPFRLLSDTDHTVAEAYGVWARRSLLGLRFEAVRRTTFIIDRDGRIVEVIRRGNPFAHADRAREAVARMGEAGQRRA